MVSVLPHLLRGADVGVLLVRQLTTRLEVLDANRVAGRLLGAGQEVRGPVLASIGVGRLVRLPEAVERALRGEKCRWCTLLDGEGGRARHLNVCVTPFEDDQQELALVQLTELPHRHDACRNHGVPS